MSTLKVGAIQSTTGNAAITVANTGIITAPNAIQVPGTILQTVVHQTDTPVSFTASGTSEELLIASNASDSTTHLSLSITPKATNSKILLTARIFCEANGNNYNPLWSFFRDSTKLGAAAAGSRRSGIAVTSMGYYADDNSSTPESVNYNYYDSPNTTSAITYACSFITSQSNLQMYINRTVTDSDSASYERGTSIIIAQEIGG